MASISFEFELNKKLAAGPVEFAYRKKNGELRIAKGTTNLEHIPEDKHPQGYDRTPGNHNKAYWDLNSEGWRAFNPDKLVWVSGIGFTGLTPDEQNTIMEYLMK